MAKDNAAWDSDVAEAMWPTLTLPAFRSARERAEVFDDQRLMDALFSRATENLWCRV